MMRTRVKICGLREAADVRAAAEAGADAVGFVCYAPSPRYVPPERLPDLAAAVPAFVTPVLLFVNAGESEIERALRGVPNAVLQFHGDEAESFCARWGRPYLRALRMVEGVDLLDCERSFATAAAILADAPAEGGGGGGKTFSWALLPPATRRRKPLVLAGGLNRDNVADAIRAVAPWAVDVSSGVESARGIKSAQMIREFLAAVRAADASQ
jgi:phosphoribosylanthranilate isomerase